MSKRKDTRTDLVAELEKLPQSNYIDLIILEAKAGEFHDYKNKKYPCGKVALVSHLHSAAKLVPSGITAASLIVLANDVINGVYDEEADADDIAEMKTYAPPELWSVLGLNK